MEILSINVGQPKERRWKGRAVTTAIFKEPVAGRVMLRTHNLDGDRQADLRVHGGPTKAVYAYPGEHYDFWRRELPGVELIWGRFGENLTTLGLDETTVHIGDRLGIGGVELIVTQPRLPCFKLGLRFGRDDIIERFLNSRRSGFYLAVLSEGEIGPCDAIEIRARDPRGVSITDVVSLYVEREGDAELLRRAIAVEALPESWKQRFQQKLEKGS
jgi:MOSC domain-containing protein YiiM